MSPESDDTVRLNGPRLGGRSRVARLLPYAAGALVVGCLAAGGTWWTLRSQPPLAPAPVAAVVAPPASLAPPPIQQAFAPAPATPVRPPAPSANTPRLASEAQVLDDAPEQLAVYRFAPQPAVVVLQFPSLAEQARMLNRVAALLEKQGFPRDRVLTHAELDARIRAAGSTPETFYYGHDYRAADLARFFRLASELNGDEQRLQELIAGFGWLERSPDGALISLVRQTSGLDLDAAARGTILRHELSHGVYFTDSAYVDWCYRFWNEVLTAQERALFTAYLAREGYDPALTDLIINETQAYLIHTRDPRFFRPADVGLAEKRVDELRRAFVAGMPAGWLRDVAAADMPQLIPARTP